MNVSVVDLSANQKKLQVEIPARKVQQELDKRYKGRNKDARIKGFRPGKVPRNILKSFYGKIIESEVSSELIQESFPEALRETDLKPLVEADVDEMHFEDDGSFSYSAVLDVCPPFDVEGYRGIELRRPSVVVRDEEVLVELEKLREQHAQLRTMEFDRPIQEKDMVLVDFVPWVDGVVYEKGKATDHMVEVGKKLIHPDFDDHLVGRRLGESFSFELDYPEEAPTKDIAGKRVRFDITVREIKEKIVPELTDEFASEVGQKYDTLDALKQEIHDQLQKREEEKVSREVHQQVIDKLLETIPFSVSEKVIEKEVDRLMEMLLRQFESQGLKIDASRLNTPEVRGDYRLQADKTVRWQLMARRIAELENVEVTAEELDAIYAQVARMTGLEAEEVRTKYARSPIVEQAVESQLQEKVLKLLEEQAVYMETSEEETRSGQE